MSQFAFLQPEFATVFEHAKRAEDMALSDPRGSCFYTRLALETAVKWLYDHDASLTTPYDTTLAALIHDAGFLALVGDKLVTKARIIKDYGNRAVHDARAVTPQVAAVALRELFHISYWLTHNYARGAKPDAGLQFDPSALQKMIAISATTAARVKAMSDEVDARAKALAAEQKARMASEEEREKLEAEITRMKAEIAEVKKANAATPDSHDYNEAETRDAFIDLLLHEAGWPLDQARDREYPVTGMPSTSGDGFVDYVLWGDDGKPLAVVEAKRTRRDARVGQQQAKLYADCLEAQFGPRPVIFYTNGYEHWLWDDVDYPPRQVQGFLKKDELMLMQQRRSTRKDLSSVKIDEDIAGRFYQTRAIRRIDEAFQKDKQRKALLVMATGSGKTRTVIALADQLMRANWAKRVLFLADRVALVNQAVNAFKTHLPDVAPVNLVTDKETEGRVYVSTYPTMMGLIDDVKNGVKRFGPGHFDLIVIDEAHRSVYRKYRAIFEYFDSLLVGLTATPRNEIDRDTYSLFDLERGVPTDSYDLEDAVADGYLVPPVAVSVPLKFQRDGITYDELSDDEKADWDDLDWSDDEDEAPTHVTASDVNKWLFNKDTVDKVLKHVMEYGLKVEEGDRLGKTIIFAKNHNHAVFIQDRFDANYPHLKGQFARIIDFKTEYAQSLIDDFSEANKGPHIAISVDMLDTGIDIPEILNLVFFKIVRSSTKFWQMIGRGTRLMPDIFGPGQDKSEFLVFDFCQNFEFFNQNPTLKEGSLPEPIGEKLFNARAALMGEIDLIGAPEEELEILRSGIEDRLIDEVSAMSLDNFIVRPKRMFVEKFKDKVAWQNLTPAALDEIAEHVAGLPSAYEDSDLAAKQFDYLILNAQLCILRTDPAFSKHQERIVKLASELETLSNVPMVQAQLPLILELQQDEYWQDITLPMLENIRRKLRLLLKLIDASKRRIVYTDFTDEIGEQTTSEFPTVASGTNKAQFDKKVQFFLKKHSDHISILKLRRDEQLTATDLSELERIFLEETDGSSEDMDRIRSEGGLGLFIRAIVGMDREAAKRAMSEFSGGRTLSANQLEFVDLIVDHLTKSGTLDPKRLYESPFTDSDDQGVAGVFSDEDVRELVGVLRSIKSRLAA